MVWYMESYKTPPRWLKVSEVADKLNVSESSVRRLLDSGELEGVKIGGSVRVDGEDVDRYLKDRRYADVRKSGMLARVRRRLLARQAARTHRQR